MCVRLFFEREPLTGLVAMMPDFVTLNAYFSWLCSVSQWKKFTLLGHNVNKKNVHIIV